MTHTPHPDVHTDGLDDECPRCAEIARDPLARADGDLLLRLSTGELLTETDRAARVRLEEQGVPVR